MVRTPCCKAEGLKRGAWTQEEDEKLIAYIQEHGEGGWRTLPEKAGLQRCGKSCRLRWANYLRPDIKRGEFSEEEEETIVKLHAIKGNKWSAIARRLPGRTDNEIKNYWNTHIKKRLIKKGIDPTTHKPIDPSKNEIDYDHKAPETNFESSDVRCQSPELPKSISSNSARLLNKVASKFALKGDRNFLAGIIMNASGGGNASSCDANSGNLTCKLLNKMATRPNLMKSILGSTCCSGYQSTSTSASSFSDDAFMPDSDSATTIGPMTYCTDTPSDGFNGVGDLDMVQNPLMEDGPFKFNEFLDACEGEDFIDSTKVENTGFMKELKDILSDDQNVIRSHDSLNDGKNEGATFEYTLNYWDDPLDLEHYNLLGSHVF